MKIQGPFSKNEQTLCCVYGCNSRINSKEYNDLSFHNLPFGRSKALFRQWINAIKLPTRIGSYMLVCSHHFLPEDYGAVGDTKVLKPDSVPSQNLPRVWRNKFLPRTYGKLIKLIEVRGIGRLRLCFEAKLSRRLMGGQPKRQRRVSERVEQQNEPQTDLQSEITTEQTNLSNEEESIPNLTTPQQDPTLTQENDKVINIPDEIVSINTKPSEEHCLTSEIEIKEEPLSEPEEQEEDETVEEMLAKMNEESQDDGHITIIENDNRELEFDDELMWSTLACRRCDDNTQNKVTGEGCDGFHDDSKFECAPCGKTFKTSRQLNAHNLSHFEYRRRGHITDKEAICKVCNKAVSTKSSLNDHMLTHSKDFKEYTCMLCDKPFRHKASLIMHINSHSLHPNHRCKLCGETFKDTDDLDRHVRKHKVVRREYTCRGCGQHFKGKQACWAHLNSHMRAKTKPLSKVQGLRCDICGRVLSTKATLKEHMFIHSGEKPFECQLCGKKIRHRANFIIHVQGHSLGQPHLCSLCGMGFSQKSELCSHTAAEHPEDLPYLCIICGMRFRTEVRFHKHAVSHDAQLEDEI